MRHKRATISGHALTPAADHQTSGPGLMVYYNISSKGLGTRLHYMAISIGCVAVWIRHFLIYKKWMCHTFCTCMHNWPESIFYIAFITCSYLSYLAGETKCLHAWISPSQKLPSIILIYYIVECDIYHYCVCGHGSQETV